ncbi:MAG: hypothetical protein ASARMPRED_006013 [Alectoria sarmentosa]|nr:MAG: hypothetical protein ASARMPRED_006013 [Alectoria sarmentosa]
MTSNTSSIATAAVRQSAAAPCFRLMDLPGELINLVYHHTLASGFTAILCTSHQVYSEAFQILYESAFLRIYYEEPIGGDPWYIAATPVSKDTMTLIQNIDICIDIPLHAIGPNHFFHNMLASFRGANAPFRQICILKLKGLNPATGLDEVCTVLRAMSGLVNFQRVCVTAIAAKFDLPLRSYDVDEGRYYLLTRARNTPFYKLAREKLEATFGPSIWHDGMKEAGRYLEFRPLEYQKSLRG